MPIPANDLSLLKRQLTQTQSRFQTFASYRGQILDNLIRRRAPAVLPPELAPYGKGVDIESAILEEELKNWKYILKLNPTKIDAVALDQHVRAKEDIEEVRIWTAGSYMRQNDGRHWDDWRIEGMVRYGAGVSRKLWHMMPEPELGEPAESDVQGQADYLKARADYYAEQGHCFEMIPVNPLTCSWWPLDPDKIEVFFQDCEVPYVEAAEWRNDQRQALRLRDNKLIFMGEGEPVEDGNSAVGDMPRVHLVIRDMLDKKTGKWWCTEYVYTSSLTKDGEQLKTYENPLGHCSFFVCPNGAQQRLETDPHLRFRPLLYELATLITEYNLLITMQAALAMRTVRGGGMYLSVANAPEEARNWLTGLGVGALEGVGAEQRFVFNLPRPGTGEIISVPGVFTKLPDLTPAEMESRIAQLREDIGRARLNRFLVGEAYAEQREGTGAGLIAQMQAAGLEPGAHLIELDNDTKASLKAEHHAIAYWDKDVEAQNQKPYAYHVVGDEPVSKEPKEAGEVVTLTAAKLARGFHLIVKTKGSTYAEEAQEKAEAYNDYEKRTITDEQLLKRLGHDDPRKQLELLEERRLEELYRPTYEKTEIAAVNELMQALTGLDLTGVGIGAPSGPSASSVTGDGHMVTTQPVGRTPSIALPPIARPEGGTSDQTGLTP